MERNGWILVMCQGAGQHWVEVFQKTAGRKSPGKSFPQRDFMGLGLRASELCGFSYLFTLEIQRHGKVFWSVSSETASKFSRYPARSDPGVTMDIFLPPVWVNWSMPGDPEKWLYCCLYDCSVLTFIQMLQESRFQRQVDPVLVPLLVGLRQITVFLSLSFFNYKMEIMITILCPYTIIYMRTWSKGVFFFSVSLALSIMTDMSCQLLLLLPER